MLIEFYGKECEHCITMDPIVRKLEKDTGIQFERYEVWYHPDNAKKMGEYDRGRCGGVPFYVNTDTDKFICGEDSYENLKKLAEGK
mgnify:FL=1